MRSNVNAPAQIEIEGMERHSVVSEQIESVLDLTSSDVERLRRKKPRTLGIVCRRSACKADLHCFRPEPLGTSEGPGPCLECGAQLFDWDQMHAREGLTAFQKFELLKNEWIRHFFFHVPLTPRIEAYARRRGLMGLVDIARKHLSQNKMLHFDKRYDATQTKMLDGTIVHWARHAVACCCRRCMAYWHDVPMTATLSTADIDYFGQLIMLYIQHRMPELGYEGKSQKRKAA